MTRWLPAILLALAATGVARADEPAAAASATACAVPHEAITGPRSAERPLPLLSGDPAHGFHTACSVPWSTLSPNKQPVPVLGCFRGSLLQLPPRAVCPGVSGPLWVGSRWVKTNEPQAPAVRADQARSAAQATCEQLQTGAYAATRDYQYTCQPARRDLKANPPAAEAAKAADSAPAPAPAPPH
jgi:hypothetical protein